MKKIIIKELKEIEKIQDDNFEFVVVNGDILVKGKHTGMVIIKFPDTYVGQLDDFKDFGYDIRILKKATLEILEEVADINCANLQRFANTGRWMIYVEDKYFSKKEWKHIEPFLEKEGYYL